MRNSVASPTFLWQSCAEPSAAWFLLWMPLALLALDGDATLGSAMVRLLAVLMVSALIWARGLGPGGALAERVFVAAWAGSWAATLGALVTAGGWSSSVGGYIGLVGTLFVGAGWLAWAYQKRQELRSARRSAVPFDASHKEPASPATIVAAWLLAALLFSVMIVSRNAHWGDGLVLLTSLACFTAFQRGRVTAVKSTD
ncbi:MAG: hypothetical protein IH936_08725 [Acidobacteria bacterium]|nr:hypothetical protein [Acidobacteriota bacterium]